MSQCDRKKIVAKVKSENPRREDLGFTLANIYIYVYNMYARNALSQRNIYIAHTDVFLFSPMIKISVGVGRNP